MKVALVHYWLVGMRGGERVLEALCEMYPDAVIITHVVDRENISPTLLKHEIRETFISRLPGAIKHYQKYLPLMPLALEMVDMQEFDLIISSESGPAKGIIPRPDALHLCYCHSPMRYIWDHFHVYRAQANKVTRIAMPFLAHRLRIWDVSSAARVDVFIANSHFVASRIEKYYRRTAHVLAPPVAVEEFIRTVPVALGDSYLLAGELVSYKRPDLAIAAFTQSGRKLVVVGDGNMRQTLEKRAGSNIRFLGKVSFAQLKDEFAQCKALIFPGEEDFGMVPVEVMASARPVIAYGKGGVLDSVVEGQTGLFFHEQSVGALNSAVDRFEAEMMNELDTGAIVTHAQSFDADVFKRGFAALVVEAIQSHQKSNRR